MQGGGELFTETPKAFTSFTDVPFETVRNIFVEPVDTPETENWSVLVAPDPIVWL